MKTVQITLDPKLLAAADKAARRLGTTRSAFTRVALRAALKKISDGELERQFRAGYAKHPVKKREFGGYS